MDIDTNIESMEDITKYDIDDKIKNDFSISNDLDDIITKVCCLSNDYVQISSSLSISNGNHSNGHNPTSTFNSVRLNGTKNDWISLKTKTTNLLSMSHNEENDDLIQLLDKFIDSYDETNNNDQSWSYDNWINALFSSPDNNNYGINILNITKTKQIFSGFLGIIQNQQTMEIQMKIGWFVVNKNDD